MKPPRRMRAGLLLGTSLVTGLLATPTFAQPYQLVPRTISPLSTGGTFALLGTLGQPEPLTLRGGAYTLTEAFFGVAMTIQQPDVPTLKITQTGQAIVISWPAPMVGFELETNDSLDAKGPWRAAGLPVLLVGHENTVTVPVRVAPQFFRLSSP